MALIPGFTHGGFPVSEALHWNNETYQKLGSIIYELMRGKPEKVKEAYRNYYKLKRHFIEHEFETKIDELEKFRKDRGFSSLRETFNLVRGWLVGTGDLQFSINDKPDIPDFEKQKNRKVKNHMKSRITKISFSRVKNLGNYETCRVEAEAEIHPGEKPTDVMKKLRAWVENQVEPVPDND